MKEKRIRLNFKQTAKGLIQFDATVEIINPYDDADPEDVMVITKTVADKLAEESLEILTSSIEKLKKKGHKIAGEDE